MSVSNMVAGGTADGSRGDFRSVPFLDQLTLEDTLEAFGVFLLMRHGSAHMGLIEKKIAPLRGDFGVAGDVDNDHRFAYEVEQYNARIKVWDIQTQKAFS